MGRSRCLLAVLLLAGPAIAGDSYSAKTLSFDYVAPEGAPVQVLWEGEIANETAADVTLCAVLRMLDGSGELVGELESAAVNVGRFGSEWRREMFLVQPELWGRTDTLRETARPSTKDPVNGRRIVPVDLYTTSWCPYCEKAREYFVTRGIAFTEYDVETDAEAAREKPRIAPGSGVPVAVIDGQVVQGYAPGTYEKLLGGKSE